jgi:hypothetical protein
MKELLRTIPEMDQLSNQEIPYKACMISLKVAHIRSARY